MDWLESDHHPRPMSLSAFPLIVHHSERDSAALINCSLFIVLLWLTATSYCLPRSPYQHSKRSPSKTETSSAKPLSLPSQSILFSLFVSLGSNPTSHFISLFPFSFLADQRKRFYRIYSINRCNLTPLFLSAELQALPIPLSLSPLSHLLVLPLLGASGSVRLLQPCTLGKTKRRSLPRDFCFRTSCGTLLWRLVLCM